MLALLGPTASILDLGLGLDWGRAEIDQAVAGRAVALSKLGLKPGDVAAIVHGGTAHFFADLMAVWAVGAAAACLDPALSDDERDRVVGFCSASLVLGDPRSPNSVAGLEVLDLSDPSEADAAPYPGARLDEPALILFTSGTTGAPKGVVLSHRAILARTALNQAAIGPATLARALATLPCHFGHGLIGGALTPLAAGGTLVLPERGLALAQQLGGLIDEYKISFLTSVPSLWRLALRMGQPAGDHRPARVHVGSAPLSAALWREIADWTGAEVVNCYGVTETANWIGGASSVRDGIEDGLVGRAWGGAFAVLDEAGAMASVGEGEVLVQTPSVMTGYLNRPDLTDQTLTGGWYRTGDRGRLDESGVLRLTGRLKDEINRGGFKIQPAEIDMLLETHPAVAEACAFGAADPVSGECVAIAIRLKPGASETSVSLRAWCLERLRRDAAPERWFFVDDIPRTSRGKVSREAVRQSLIPS